MSDASDALRTPESRHDVEAPPDDPVLCAAVTLYAERGFDGFTLEEVAERAGVTRFAVYRRWRSKGELVLQALAAYLQFDFTCPRTGSIRGDLVWIVKQQIRAVTTEPSAFALAVEGLREGEFGEVIRRTVRECRDAYREAFEAGVARGELSRTLDVELALDLVFGAVWARSFSGRPLPGDAAEEIVDLVLGGLECVG